jgi:beta-galactosidase
LIVHKDIDLMKEAGAVFSRLMHNPQAPNLNDYLDEKGMMVIAEIPVWGKGDPQVIADNPRTKQWLAEMITRDYNHPSIIGWSCGNEIVKHYEYVKTMNDYMRRELDPHRIVTYVSFTAWRKPAKVSNDGVTHSDLAMINMYAPNGPAFTEGIRYVRKEWPEKPVFMAEFGVAQIGVGESAIVPGLEEIWASMAAEPYLIGASLWTFNDYRSGFENTPASGNREWGVVDVNRNLKGAYQQVRRAFSPVAGLTFDSARIILTPRAAGALPSYPLRGYL